MSLQKSRNNFQEEYAVSLELNSTAEVYSYYQTHLIFKRTIDILLGLIGFILTIPILLIFIIAIKIETSGPAFYLQERVGINGKYFNIIKLRSMKINAEEGGAQWAQKNDLRVTKVGKFMRKNRIDEIPQFINVLRGDMSIIGPRPERPMFTAKFNDEVPGFVNRLSVKPGLTGWAQVNGGYEITPEEKLMLDLYYINNSSIKMEFKIILKTVKIVFTGDGAR